MLLCVFSVVAAEPNAPPPGRTFGGVFFPANSLGYALETNYTRATNGKVNYTNTYQVWNDLPWTGYAWNNTNIARYRLNTNSVIYGKRGATAISVAQFGGTANRMCLITRRHAVGAGHYGGVTNGLVVYFMGTNGLVHAMTTSNTWVEPIDANGRWLPGFENREIVTFTQDVPADVEPMKLASPLLSGQAGVGGLVEHLLPPITGNRFPAILFVCQHGYCGRLLQAHPGGGAIGINGGDSGSPGFMLLGDECVNIGGISMGYPTTNMLVRINALTRSLGLNTNNYQPWFVSLTNFPKWPH